jgi:hypothetical protein
VKTEPELALTEQHLDDIFDAGISDPAWWNWFEGEISHCFNPWRDWLGQLRFPCEGPLRNGLETDITDAIKAADALRLATIPQTAAFGKQWADLRQHEDLDGGGKNRRRRYMVWRAAALNVLCQRNHFQDSIDAGVAAAALVKTMKWFWPELMYDGSYDGGNFWLPRLQDADGTPRSDSLASYAAMVLLLMHRSMAQPTTRPKVVAGTDHDEREPVK